MGLPSQTQVERKPNGVRAQVRVMWAGGPSRRWSKTRCSEATMPYGENDGYAGNYVCQGCGVPTCAIQRVIRGVQEASRWLCAECRDTDIHPKRIDAQGAGL